MSQLRSLDAMGGRCKFGVVVPSTNTIVEPEFHQISPTGVTCHSSRFLIPNMALNSDADFETLVGHIKDNLDDAVDGLTPALVDHVIVGISAESFWDGVDGANAVQKRLQARAGCGITLGSTAAQTALEAVGAKRIAVLTPYWPVADARVEAFFEQCGFTVVRQLGLKATSPVNIAEINEETLRHALAELDGPDIDAIIQCGTNLFMARLAAEAERWLEKPVIAINTALYWRAMRDMGIEDKVEGFGRLLRDH
jgi:maleate isomerase